MRRWVGIPRRLGATSLALALALALMACSWSPNSWFSALSAHTPPELKREARAIYQAATSAATATPTNAPVVVLMDDAVDNTELPSVHNAPAAFELVTSASVNIAEPGAGVDTNFTGPVVANSGAAGAFDDTESGYHDPLYATLCGPGAVAVALYYWPSAGDQGAFANVTDGLLAPSVASSWGDEDIDGVYRMRGYIMRLAYQIKVPGWHEAGMLPQSTRQSSEVGGATLQVVRDTLNWEVSGEDPQTWSNYFYHVQWNSDFPHTPAYPMNLYTALHTAIVTDLARNHAPVIVEITAGYLPNWHNTNPVYHFIAITGYDDTAGTYTYLDTCKAYTGCNSAGGMDAPGRHTIDQLQLSAAVASIPTNQTTGDGGWVW